jgi:cysteine-rich repeat protein
MAQGSAHAQTVMELRTLIDSDNNPATGCTVNTAAGVFAGADIASVTRVDLSATDPVGDVSQEVCQGGVLVTDASFVPASPQRWSLGVAAAGAQVDVVESYAKLLVPAASLRLGFSASTTDGSMAATALLSPSGAGAGGVLLQAPPTAVAVPALGLGGLMGLAALLGWVTQCSARFRRWTASCAVLCLLLVVGVAWSAIVRDGAPADWGNTPALARSASSGPLQLSAVYAQLDGMTLNLRYDVDLGIRDGATQDDGPYNMTVGTPLAVPAPGLLANDSLGSPAMQVREIRVAGSTTTVAAGGAVPLAGTSLTVQSDGSFALGAPTTPGNFQWEYRAGNRYKQGSWSIARLAVAPLPMASCGNGIVEAGEACDDGNLVTETSCPGGATTCTICTATCTLVPIGPVVTPAICGNGIVEGTEACDDGNTVTETSCPGGATSCNVCSSTCTLVPIAPVVIPAVCGNGIVESGEACDDGNTVTETSCPGGATSCNVCSSSCTLVHIAPVVIPAVCGNGIVETGEVCDDGNNINETSCPGGAAHCNMCNSTCTATIPL